jgi:glycosyltransferase involved in cell wall biosynthesis
VNVSRWGKCEQGFRRMAARRKPAGIRSLVYGVSKGKAGIESLSVSKPELPVGIKRVTPDLARLLLLGRNSIYIKPLMKTLTALIPFFNEERTIAELVRQLDSLPKGVLSECIFVDDGSTDSSSNLLTQALEGAHFKSQIISKVNGGKASAIKEGAKALGTTHAVILDADLELNTSDVARLWAVVQSDKSDIVFGYRSFIAQSAFTYRYARGNQFLSHLYGLLFNEVITDVMCGFKLMPSQYFQECPFRYRKFGIEVELPLYLWLKRLRPFEILVDYKPRSREEGKVIGVKDALQIIGDLVIFRLRMARKRVT